MSGKSDSEDLKALYVGNLHPYVNEAVLQVPLHPPHETR